MTMDSYRGDLLLDGDVMFEGLEFWIEEIRPPSPAKLSEWRGEFEAPHDQRFHWQARYELRLDDGRRGVLLVKKFAPGAEGATCRFTFEKGLK